MFCETTWLDREFGIPFYYSEHVRNFSSTFSSKKTTFKKVKMSFQKEIALLLHFGVALHTKVSSFHRHRSVFQDYFSTSFYQDENAKTYWHRYLSVCLVTKDSWYSAANDFWHFFWPFKTFMSSLSFTTSCLSSFKIDVCKHILKLSLLYKYKCVWKYTSLVTFVTL